jgi:hypothetical protein
MRNQSQTIQANWRTQVLKDLAQDNLVRWIVLTTSLVLTLSAAFFILSQPRILKENFVELQAASFPLPSEEQKGPFACPSLPSFCQNGTDISVDSSYIGFGAKIEKGSPLIAAFDGEVSSRQIKIAKSSKDTQTQDITMVLLTNKDKLLRAAYYFVGPLPENKTVKRGETIGNTEGEPMPLYQNSSLVFVLTRNDTVMSVPLGGELVRLNRGDFN